MKHQKKLIALFLAMSSSIAFAGPTTIKDIYIGSDDHGYGDVIGDRSKFDIRDMVVTLDGGILTVTVNTTFANNGLRTFASSTDTAYGMGKGIGFGDLFLSSGWDPDDSVAGFKSDDYSTGNDWDYGIALGDRWFSDGTATTSSAALYSLDATQNQDALLSDDFVSSDAIFRNGQEVAVNTDMAAWLRDVDDVIIDPSSGGGYGSITFSLDVTGTSLATADTIGLHWAMTCGNDTIEGEIPEPATLGLIGLGLLGLGGLRSRKKAQRTSQA
jgi:hypothetical protein